MSKAAAAPNRFGATPEESWLWLPVILCLQAAISLILMRNTAFEDEALYLFAGRQILSGLLHHSVVAEAYGAYFSGCPCFYPVIAGLLDMLGGLEAARMFSLLCTLGITVCVYLETRQLFDRKSAILAAALLAGQGSMLFLGRLATYDALCLLLLTMATVVALYASSGRSPWWTLGIGPLLGLAILAKYAGLLFVPTIFALLIWRSLEKVGWRSMLPRVAIAVFSLAAVFLILCGTLGHDTLGGFSSTTLNRVVGLKTNPGEMIEQVMMWGGPVFILAFIAVLLNGPVDLVTLLLLFGSSLLAPAYHIYKGEMISLHKHMSFGLLFVMPLAGFTVGHLFSNRPTFASRLNRLVGVTICVFTIGLGVRQAHMFYHDWSSSSDLMRLLRTQVRLGSGHYLAEEFNESRYYLQDVTCSWQWDSLYFFSYTDRHQRRLIGDDAYRAAIDEGYFDLVELNFGYNAALALSIRRALQMNERYELIAKLPSQSSYGTGYFWLWRRRR